MNIVIATGNAGKLKEISEFLGEIKNISPEEVARKTYENSLELFNI